MFLINTVLQFFVFGLLFSLVDKCYCKLIMGTCAAAFCISVYSNAHKVGCLDSNDASRHLTLTDSLMGRHNLRSENWLMI